MSSGLHILEASAELAERLAPLMRAEDAAECEASMGWTPLEALLESLAYSCRAWCLVRGEEPLAMWGLAPARGDGLMYPGEAAIVWLLTGRGVETARKPFLCLCFAEVQRLLGAHPVLFNYVDARYTRALRWARRLGAEVAPPAPFGQRGLPFHRVTWRAHAWAQPQSP